MKLKNIFSPLFLTALLVACSAKNDCGIADSVTEIRTVTTDKKIYFLILRTSGLQDKVSFYELYEKSPKFDACGDPDVNPISTAEIEEPENIKKLIIQDRSLKIIYSKNKSNILDPSKILVEVK